MGYVNNQWAQKVAAPYQPTGNRVNKEIIQMPDASKKHVVEKNKQNEIVAAKQKQQRLDAILADIYGCCYPCECAGVECVIFFPPSSDDGFLIAAGGSDPTMLGDVIARFQSAGKYCSVYFNKKATGSAKACRKKIKTAIKAHMKDLPTDGDFNAPLKESSRSKIALTLAIIQLVNTIFTFGLNFVVMPSNYNFGNGFNYNDTLLSQKYTYELKENMDAIEQFSRQNNISISFDTQVSHRIILGRFQSEDTAEDSCVKPIISIKPTSNEGLTVLQKLRAYFLDNCHYSSKEEANAVLYARYEDSKKKHHYPNKLVESIFGIIGLLP